MPHPRSLLLGALTSVVCATSLSAQVAGPAHHWELVSLRSGIQSNASPVEGVVYREFVTVSPHSPWMRLYFTRVQLGKGSYLRIASLRDGDVQTMEMHHIDEWQSSSAFFNGNSVLIEIVAAPGTMKNYLEIDKVMVGDLPTGPQTDTICGSTDDRVPSTNAATGRIDPIGCTGWIIDVPTTGTDRLHLSAGHCFSSGVLEFDVPASSSNCSLVHPPAAKQFAIDAGSSLYVNGGPGNDYWVYRCFPNSTTGLTTYQTQAAAFTLAAAIPAVSTTLRNYGFGLDGTPTNGGAAASSCSCSSPNGVRNQTQQTNTGPLVALSGNSLAHGIDTCGGNSGSVLLNASTGQAVAIHTHGGCTASGGSNSGTAITHPGLQAAIQTLAGGTGGSVPNDECAGALPVVDGINGPMNNVGATNSSTFACSSTAGKDVWFRYVASCSGTTTFDTCSATRTFDTVLEVLSGTCGSLTSIGCNDDTCGFGSSVSVTLTAGQPYFIRVGGYGTAQGTFDLTITSCNLADECTGAIPLQLGANGPFSNGLATNSTPAFPCGSLVGKDLWFTFQAPPSTIVTFTTCNTTTTFDTVIQAFSGSCGALVALGCNDDDFTCTGNTLKSRLSVQTAGATTLWVRVGGYSGLSGVLQLDVSQTPANDDCGSAVALATGVNGPFSNLNANTSSTWSCGSGTNDVWFTYQPPMTGTMIVDTCSAARTFDTTLEVFSGSCGSLSLLGCNDDACGLGSSLSVPVTQGQTYWIRMGGYFGSQGQAELTVACILTGDECSMATPLAVGVNGPFTNSGATNSSQTATCTYTNRNDVWFTFQAPVTTPITFRTCTGTRTFDTVMEVYSGNCSALTYLACNDDYCSLGSRVQISAVGGTTYFVRVAGFNGAIGAFDVEVVLGTGLGSIVRNVGACGGTTINSTGNPNLGGTVNTQLGNITGVPFFGFGFLPQPMPFCGGCTVGHEWATALYGYNHNLVIPVDPGMIGVRIAVQGACLYGTGGCPAPMVTFTDTMVITIG